MLIILGCTKDNEYIPFYQDAIYIMDSDGDNKQKVIDVEGCTNVQFIQDSNKILFMTSRYDGSYMKQLHTVNIDGSDSLQISGDYLLKDEQPAVSDDGSKIVFWALHESRDAVYDLYMTDPLGTEIINLTNTENESEKDALFIQYQEQEYLLYVTYFREDNIDYSTISMMNIDTFEIDTLYVEEIVNEWGFKHPAYHSSIDLLFVVFGQVGTTAYSNLILYDSIYDGNQSIIPVEMYGQRMEINHVFNKLIFQSSDIMTYDIVDNEVNFLADGYKFNSFNDKVTYCTGYTNNDSKIYSIYLDKPGNTLLTEDGFYPRYSPDGSQIVYIGHHLKSQEKNLITNYGEKNEEIIYNSNTNNFSSK